MDFVPLVTQINSLLLKNLLEMESTFFAASIKSKSKGGSGESATQKVRREIDDFIVQSCHFLECIYDPFLRWRTFLGGKVSSPGGLDTPEDDLPPTPVALHQVRRIGLRAVVK